MKKAFTTFWIGYLGVPFFAIGLYLAITLCLGNPIIGTLSPKDDAAFRILEKILPFLNLVMWTIGAWIYFMYKKPSKKAALFLGLGWMVAAFIGDFFIFQALALIVSQEIREISLGQVPWIMLTYVAIVAAPFTAIGTTELSSKSSSKQKRKSSALKKFFNKNISVGLEYLSPRSR
jgi:hypothetical protein